MSLIEGMPNVLLEAIASETITIISDIGAHRELIDEESTFFIPPKNEIKLAATILEVLKNLDHYQYKVNNASCVIADLTVTKIFSKYHRKYTKLLNIN